MYCINKARIIFSFLSFPECETGAEIAVGKNIVEKIVF